MGVIPFIYPLGSFLQGKIGAGDCAFPSVRKLPVVASGCGVSDRGHLVSQGSLLCRSFASGEGRPAVERRIMNWFDRHTSQEVCPWNAKFSRAATEPACTPRAELVEPDSAAFAAMDDAEFRQRFGDTPLSRAKRGGLARNAVTARGNINRR
jgi:hypothetical protein